MEPENTNQEAERDAFISRNACDAGALSRYRHVIGVDDFLYYIGKITTEHAAEIDRLKALLVEAADSLEDRGHPIDACNRYREAGGVTK
jgi:hypothetical protein